MATLASGYTFSNNETVTPTKLNNLVNAATLSGIVDADVSSTAGIANSKLAGAPTTSSTPSTIVLRDASGNFSAGTISANLTGNVTGNLTGNVTGTATGLASPGTKAISKAWVAFTAPAALASVSISGTTTAMTATKTSHNLNTGDCITIFGGTGNTAVLNGTWSITRTDADHFTFSTTSAPGSAISAFSVTVYPVQIFASYNISTIGIYSTSSSGVYDVTFSSGVTWPTYTTYSSATATTFPAYWVTGNVENLDAAGSWPLGLRVSSDQKTASKFRVKATSIQTGSSTVNGADFPAVFLSVFSL